MQLLALSKTRATSGFQRQGQDSSFLFLIRDLNNSIYAFKEKNDESHKLDLVNKVKSLNKNYTFNTASQNKTEILLEEGTLNHFPDILIITQGDPDLLKELAKCLKTLLQSYLNYKNTISYRALLVSEVTELFIYKLSALNNSKRLTSAIDLVNETLKVYVDSPILVEKWLSQNDAKILPLFTYIYQFLHIYNSFIDCDPEIIDIRTEILSNVLKLCSSSPLSRKNLFKSLLDEEFLLFPYTLVMSSPGSRKLKRHLQDSRVIPESFNTTIDCLKYRKSFSFFIAFINGAASLDFEIAQHYMDCLEGFLHYTLQRFQSTRNVSYCSYFYEAFKLIIKETSVDLNRKLIQNIFQREHFRILMWSAILCFQEVESSHPFDKLSSRSTHDEVIDFLEYLFDSDNEEVCLFLGTSTDSFSSLQWDETSSGWALSYVHDYICKGVELKETIINKIHENMKLHNSESGHKIKGLDSSSFFYQLILVRMNLFYLFYSDENKSFIKLFSKLVKRSKARIICEEEAPLVNSILKLDSVPSQIHNKTYEIAVDSLCFPYNDVVSLTNLQDTYDWLNEINQNASRKKKVSSSLGENVEIYRSLVLDCYCQLKACHALNL